MRDKIISLIVNCTKYYAHELCYTYTVMGIIMQCARSFSLLGTRITGCVL